MPRKQVIKLFLFAAFIIIAFAIKLFTPLGKQMTIENLQLFIEPLGIWGIALFIVAFCLAIIFQLPGVIFIGASIPLFGSVLGPIVAYLGSLAAVIASFYFARSMGGNAMAHIKSERIQRILLRVETKPIKTIILLRLLMWVAPPLNYALAFSKITTQKYIYGSAIGLLIPISVLSIGYKYFVGLF
ncbi:MAG: VTT domain-containing protein [Chitinophagales bacterium]